MIGDPLRRLVDSREELAAESAKAGGSYIGGFEGTAAKLLAELNELTHDEPRIHGWPQTPKGLSGQLRKIAPALRHLGYHVDFTRAGDAEGSRIITVDTRTSYALRCKSKAAERQMRQMRQTEDQRSGASDASVRSDAEAPTSSKNGPRRQRTNGPLAGDPGPAAAGAAAVGRRSRRMAQPGRRSNDQADTVCNG